MTTIIRDGKGREMIRIGDNGRIAIARYPDYTEEAKQYILSIYKDTTNGDIVKLRDFLDFKTEENEFCN